jgi:hypothetical protein
MKQRKKISKAQRAKEFKPTYFFGYGSLLIPQGVNGRGMRHDYIPADLSEAMLNGYERSFSGFFHGRNFYGLLENKSARCNGVVFKIDDWYDYRALLMNEGATSLYKQDRTYWPIDVTKKITEWDVPKGHRVIALVCKEDKSLKGTASDSYIRFCHRAANHRGDQFAETFLATGGVPYDPKGIMALAKKFRFRLFT